MAIAPPSDIVMDVVNAADPMKMQEAQNRLQISSASQAAALLERDGKGFSTEVASAGKTFSVPAGNVNISHKDSKTPETYRKFEAMVLQSFIKSMLPNDSSEVYGEGMSGDVWKGMMAEQLANNMSKNGGIGIADRMMRGATYDLARHPADHAAMIGHVNNVASRIPDEQQRKAIDDILPGVNADNNT